MGYCPLISLFSPSNNHSRGRSPMESSFFIDKNAENRRKLVIASPRMRNFLMISPILPRERLLPQNEQRSQNQKPRRSS